MGWLPFFLRAQLNNPGFLPDIDSTNQSSTLPLHSPYKTFHIRVSVQPRRAQNIEASPSEWLRLFFKRTRNTTCQPSSSFLAWGAPLQGCSTPRKNEDCCIWIKISIVGGNRLESSPISLHYKCFCWNKLASRYELHTVEYKDRMEDI